MEWIRRKGSPCRHNRPRTAIAVEWEYRRPKKREIREDKETDEKIEKMREYGIWRETEKGKKRIEWSSRMIHEKSGLQEVGKAWNLRWDNKEFRLVPGQRDSILLIDPSYDEEQIWRGIEEDWRMKRYWIPSSSILHIVLYHRLVWMSDRWLRFCRWIMDLKWKWMKTNDSRWGYL